MSHIAPDPLDQSTPRKSNRFVTLSDREAVRLAEYEHHIVHVGGELFEEHHFVPRHRRIGSEHDKGGVDVRNESSGNSCTAREDRADTGRVH